jgi:hypothetical protein
VILPGSRYAHTPVVEPEPGRRSLALRRIPTTPSSLVHVVMEGERLDHLAARFYGDATRYWRILDANPDELNPLALLRRGAGIAVPPDREPTP